VNGFWLRIGPSYTSDKNNKHKKSDYFSVSVMIIILSVFCFGNVFFISKIKCAISDNKFTDQLVMVTRWLTSLHHFTRQALDISLKGINKEIAIFLFSSLQNAQMWSVSIFLDREGYVYHFVVYVVPNSCNFLLNSFNIYGYQLSVNTTPAWTVLSVCMWIIQYAQTKRMHEIEVSPLLGLIRSLSPWPRYYLRNSDMRGGHVTVTPQAHAQRMVVITCEHELISLDRFY
jgi:hypothetical protein